MIIVNYKTFLLESEMMNWNQLNESNQFEILSDRILTKLEKAYEVGETVFLNLVVNIFRYFKKNPKILALVVGLLISKFHFSKQQIIDVVDDDTIISTEELFAKSRADKGLPEDEVVSDYSTTISGNIKKFLNDIANKESSLDPEKINSIGYMGKYQFGEIALKDILKAQPGESPEEYKSRVEKFWPKNFGRIRDDKDYNFFKSRFRNKGIDFWPEHKQDLAMKQLLKNNKAYLGEYIDKWVGKKKKGITITLSGLLAGAHLLGPSNVKAFLDHGTIARDGFGTPITEYIDKFGGYNINL